MLGLHHVVIITVITTAACAVSGILYSVLKIRDARERDQNQVRFFNSMKQGLNCGWIYDLGDIENIYAGMQGRYDDLYLLIRRFIVHYLVTFQKPLEEHSTKEIRSTVYRIIKELERASAGNFLLAEDRMVLAELHEAVEAGNSAVAQSKIQELVILLGAKNQKALISPANCRRNSGLLVFSAAMVVMVAGLMAMLVTNI